MKEIDAEPQYRHRGQVLSRLRPGLVTSRGKLALETDLSPATIFRVTRSLVKERVLRELKIPGSGVGRPSPALELNQDYASVLGMSLSMSAARVLLMNLQGEVLVDEREGFDWRGGREGMLKAMHWAIKRALKNQVAGTPRLAFGGLAIPGQWDDEQGISLTFPRVNDWFDVPVRALVEEASGVPMGLIGYAPALALAEQRNHKVGDSGSLLCIEVEENVAMGIIVNGRILKGATGNAGELAHLTVDLQGPVCHCGNRGCLETMATCQTVIDEISRGDAAEGLFAKGEAVTYEGVIARAQRGHPFAIRLLARVATTLGLGVAATVNLFNPRAIYFTGRFFDAGELVMGPLVHSIKERAYPVMTRSLTLERSSLGSEASALGAGILAIQEVLQRV